LIKIKIILLNAFHCPTHGAENNPSTPGKAKNWFKIGPHSDQTNLHDSVWICPWEYGDFFDKASVPVTGMFMGAWQSQSDHHAG
jgi:hypothetical protein